MATPPKTAPDSIAEALTRLALELNFVEADSDSGLLPINSFLIEMEETLRPVGAPLEIVQAVGQARSWIDRLFDTTAKFDPLTIHHLTEWQQWMTAAVSAWSRGTPCPACHAQWAVPTSGSLSSAPAISPIDSTDSAPTAPATEPALLLSIDADLELLREFINESQEHLQNIEHGVLILEENPADADTLNSIFRAFHTFKGGSGFLNLTPIKNLAHELESLLDAARQNKITIDSAIIDLILQGGDTLKLFVGQIGEQLNGTNSGQAILVPTLDLIAQVQSVLSVSPGQAAPAAHSLSHSHSRAELAPPAEMKSSARPDAAVAPEPTRESALLGDAPEAPTSGPVFISDPISRIITAGDSPAADSTSNPPRVKAPINGQSTGSGFVKVDTAKLDSLIDLVGELVISESMVVEDPELLRSPSRHLARNLSQLRRITSDLQRTAMSLRMVPIRATFQKMTRLVRDLAAKQDKQVQLALSGEDTELDRNIVEEISDPLVHMIRNAADHGVEKPEARIAKGKPALGTIHLRAFHRGGNIVIQIQDDGNGLAKEKLLNKAIEKGIVKPGETLTDKEIYDLIFAPGFSTAEAVTDISGRGVGMDVVRRNIEKLRGKVDIETVLGQGTTFTIYLPLTLAIIDGMIVSSGGERYIIPTLSVRESFRPKPEMISTVRERGEMVNVRGRLSPLLRLADFFNRPAAALDPSEGIVVVVESGQQVRCLLVDELIGKQEVVIKSLGGALKKNAALAGGAVLGDGRIGLILNVDALVKLNVPDSSPTPGASRRLVPKAPSIEATALAA